MEDFNFLKKVGKGAGILLIGVIASKVLTYAFRAVVAKYFGASIYGLLILAIAITSFVASIAVLGLPGGLLRYVAYYIGKANKEIIAPMTGSVVKLVFPISLFLGFIIFLFAKEISIVIFHKPELALFLQIAAFIIPLLGLYNIFDNVLQAFQDAKALVISRNLADPLSKFLILVLMIFVGAGALGVVFAYILGIAISIAIMLFFLQKKIPNFGAIFFKPGRLSKELIYYSLPLLFSNFLIMTMVWTDVIILGLFVNSASVGIYDVASATSRLPVAAALALSTMFMPAITEVFARDKSQVGRLYNHVSKWAILLLLPMLFFLAMFSKTMLTAFFGSEFSAGDISLIVLLPTQLFTGLTLLSSNIFEMLKRTKLIFLNCILVTVINIVLNFILIPKMGIVGAAIATSVSTFIVGSLYIIQSSYLIRTNPFDFSILKMLFSIAVPVVILVVIFRSFIIEVPLWYALVIGFLFTSVYVLLLFVTKSFDSEDIELFKIALRKYNPIKK